MMDDNCLMVIDRLRKLTQVDVIEGWYDVSFGNSDDNLPEKLILDEFELSSVNEKGYIVFAKGREVKWLVQKITISESLQLYPVAGLSLRLLLTWWAEDAKIFINGKLVQEGDLFDSSARILVTDCAIPKQEFTIAIRLVSPNHDIGALMRSHILYEWYNDNLDYTAIDPSFVANEFTVLYKYLSEFEPEKLTILAEVLNSINWKLVNDAEEFNSELNRVRDKLLPLSKNIKQRKFHILGHAHLDMAWLWETKETYQVAQRTFKSVLNLQQDYPYLTFCHTSPALYEWIEENNAPLFSKIQDAIKNNSWEALGGMWIEPEVNLISGESLIRQLLYGQQYYREKFGDYTRVAWLPDSFGFPWQLPQILKQCGIDYFVTGKLHWNDTNKFPHGAFYWESPDKTRIFTVMSPPNVTGVMDTNPITMTNYAVEWESQTGLQDIFWLPGVGDHGGGPTKDMLEVATRWSHSPFFPEIKFSTATEYLNRVTSLEKSGRREDWKDKGDREARGQGDEGDKKDYPQSKWVALSFRTNNQLFPVWNSELYLELHRGCYTTHGDQKKFNRYCEGLLYEAELFATIASLVCNEGFVDALFSDCNQDIIKKPKSQHGGWIAQQSCGHISRPRELLQDCSLTLRDERVPLRPQVARGRSSRSIPHRQPLQQLIETAWKKVLFNQFHDILPGTSIPEVFIEANKQWQQAIEIGEHILEQSLTAITSCIDLPIPPVANAQPIVIFNSLNWTRSHIVSIATEDKYYCVYDLEGNLVESEVSKDNKLLFLAQDIPSVGYKVYWIVEIERVKDIVGANDIFPEWILENEYLKAIVDYSTGNLASIYDKINSKEILAAPGNHLQAFTDKGQYWDAWNIDSDYEQKMLQQATLKSIQWLEKGVIRNTIRVIRIIGKSEFIQDYILEKNSPILKISTIVDWQETHVLVKACFPLNLESDYATYETACGAITRTTKPQTSEEKAQWEVPALKWVDISDSKQNYGVSLLNDCKYGYDIKPNRIRISLLRSPVWPNPDADKGKHQFTYGIYPHSLNWKQGKTVRKSYEFNLPLKAIKISKSNLQKQVIKSNLPPVGQFLNLSAPNLILMALKTSIEDQIILRCYEWEGETAELSLRGILEPEIISAVDCLENERVDNNNINTPKKYSVRPWKINTFKLKTIGN